MEVLTPRDVPLGGLRAMTVRRTLPQRQRSLIGAWCFLDHYGPDEVDGRATGMVVPPHPHTGLQTVSWLFTGEIEHRDSAGHHAFVRPGELQPDDGGPGHQPQRVLHPRHHHPPRRPALAGPARRRPAGRADLRALRSRAGRRATGWEARVFIGLAARLDVAGDDVQPAARGRARPGGRYDAAGAGRPVVRARRARRHRHASASTASRWPHTSSASSSPGPTRSS